MNLKRFTDERVAIEHPEHEQAKAAATERGKKVEEQNDDEPSLAEFLLGRLVQGQTGGDPDEPPPRIRNREEYYAALEKKRQPTAAKLPGETAAG